MRRAVLCLLALLLLSTHFVAQNQPRPAPRNGAREVTLDRVAITNAGFTLRLREPDSGGTLEMMVGFLEGQSIEMARRRQKPPRPMTHDIFLSFLQRNGWELESVFVRDLVSGTYLADLVFVKNGQKQTYDARPSDGIALAVRTGGKIFVSEKLLQRDEPGAPDDPNQRRIRRRTGSGSRIT